MPSRHPAPFGCYALTVSGTAAWACPYTDFPLVEIHPNRPERPVRGVGEPRTKRGRTISARSPAIPRTLKQRAWRGASTVTSSPVRTTANVWKGSGCVAAWSSTLDVPQQYEAPQCP
ncbi:hypothetical protein GCM10010298_36280 [Streptomyces microflavus]|uniref:Uncharacterized protein n=1 Tax=Streptomyces microflavus TaxID=1919 RepID=A0A7J0D3X6_STRMI|nr:hypothetical protein Smic_79640 [Streptomyces microflavus]GGX68084.1 hypothetical protein GCM10010298_36280 [Streptomyces microflavus]